MGFEGGLNVLAGEFFRISYVQHLLSSYTQFCLCLGHMFLVYFVSCFNLKQRTLSFPVLIDQYLVQPHKTIAHTHVFYVIISNCRNVCTEVNVSPGNSTPRGVNAAQTSHGSKWLVFLFANKLAFQERIPRNAMPSLRCYFNAGVVVHIHVSHLVEFFQLKAEPTYAVENNVLCYTMLTAC